MESYTLENARSIYQNVIQDIFRRKNVVAVGLGYKIKDGERTDQLSLVVSVIQKVPAAELAPEDLVPQQFAGLRTDVLETGPIRALMSEDPRVRRRPAPPGVSLGHRDITAGTFGMLVQRDGQPYILSNNHVLADTNAGSIGDPIYQPGPADGGTPNDRIGALAEFEAIDFGETPPQCEVAETLAAFLNLLARTTGSSHRLQPFKQTPGVNLMDAALAEPDQPASVRPDVLEIGLPTDVAAPELGLSVQKMGRTTGLTHGFITQVDVTVDVDYLGRTARFVDQVFLTSMSKPGDSGAGIFDTERRAVGLLFAGSERVTIMTPIQRVLDRFAVGLVKQQDAG
ncbi:MAG: hypothetical protein ACP5JG_02490 [Anaerolineae bacterium]